MAEAKSPEGGTTKGIRLVLRALRYRNYRLFFGGQCISLIGTWMQSIALSWLVYRMTDSAFILGIVGFAGQIPAFLLAPFAGVLADRWNKHRMIVATQSLAMVQAMILAALALTSTIAVWHIVVLSLFLGIINAFDIPTRQSFILEMIESKEDLPNAIALNSSMFNGARLVGPSIAGITIAAVGEGTCFLLNAVSYLAVIGALLAMRIPPRISDGRRQHVLRDLRSGFRYVYGFSPIRDILLLLALVSLMGMPFTVLMPVVARDILRGDAHTYGFLMGAVGVGALSGAIYLASRKSVVGLSRWIPRAASLFGAGLVFFAVSRSLWLSLVMLLVVGFGMMVQMASSNTLLQTLAEDDKRGRVMSFYTMAFMGMVPFGSLWAGSAASRIGATPTILISGIASIAGALVFASRLKHLRQIIHPLYRKMGIIPEVSAGVQSATHLTMPPEE